MYVLLDLHRDISARLKIWDTNRGDLQLFGKQKRKEGNGKNGDGDKQNPVVFVGRDDLVTNFVGGELVGGGGLCGCGCRVCVCVYLIYIRDCHCRVVVINIKYKHTHTHTHIHALPCAWPSSVALP